ncbi:hypothetical protein [Nonomuraea gerenzanensis]|uniref:Lipoprotein n=1 Tax=Nonomuraea gerenzanensis TaxID=93944 RepID=A0A1M4E0G5_9ACTN|nr:hypothetical protein [Nonomuraea gerenzanensis]UBU14574.1 hypothetical protein LCN96_05980 [Nonomuraea gerenzanensis]SBO92290.1 hypothetical protein BN4615_P1804 [Nonomuraea gerenzanensis]
MISRLAHAVVAFLVLPVAGACSASPADAPLKDPAQWPLAAVRGLTSHGKLPDEADRALAQIKVGSYDMIAWISSSGLCGLAGSDWSTHVDMVDSEGRLEREEGFSGPLEPAVGSSHEDKVSLFCTSTRMLVRVEGETAEPFVSGDAVAQVVNGGLNAVVGTEEALRESLPRADVTRGG